MGRSTLKDTASYFLLGIISFAVYIPLRGQIDFRQTVVLGDLTINSALDTSTTVLEVKSHDQGILVPRMTTAQRDLIQAPQAGMIIFNTTEKKLQGFVTQRTTSTPIGNTSGFNGQGGSNVFTGQSAIVITPPFTGRLHSLKIRLFTVTNVNNEMPGLILSSGIPFDCGGSNTDIVQTVDPKLPIVGWNEYNFDDPPLLTSGQSYYLWLEPKAGVTTRISYASVSTDSNLFNLFPGSCNQITNDTNVEVIMDQVTNASWVDLN